jgi:hypothetical protein
LSTASVVVIIHHCPSSLPVVVDLVVVVVNNLSSRLVPQLLSFLLVVVSGVPARLGLKAPALAWPEAALAFSNLRPSQSRQTGLGPGLAWPRPRLLYGRIYKFYQKKEINLNTADNITTQATQVLSQ